MAIKRKTTEPEAITLPPEFLSRTKRAFSLQAISAKYKDSFDEEKVWISEFLETTTEIQVDMGTGLRTPEGLVCMKSRDNWKIDMAAIETMVKTGELSLATVLAIATINAGKLKDCIGAERFAKLAVNAPTEHLAMTATPEFKAEIDKVFDLRAAMGTPIAVKVESAPAAEPAPAKRTFSKTKPAEAPAPASSSLAKAQAAAAKATKPASAEDDLEAILKGV